MSESTKKRGIGKGIIIIVLVVLLLISGVGKYNKLVNMQENVNEKWAQVENVLKRRADLIPNLVETVKGYAAHEEEVLTKVTKARAHINEAATPGEYAAANEELSQALASLNVVVEAYPELKANQNFLNLQDELAGTENRISTERMRYNEAVGEYNRLVKRFPMNIYAKIFGFSPEEYFEISEADKEVPKVEF